MRFFDLEDAEAKHEAGALHAALPALEGDCIVCYGDVLFRKFIPRELAEVEADFAVFVDTNWQESRNRTRYADYVSCSQPFSRRALCSAVQLRTIAPDLDPARIHGEWMGFLKVARRAVPLLRQILSEIAADPAAVRTEDMGALMRRLIEKGQEIRVLYTSGHWLDIDTVEDALEGGSFC